MKEKTCSRCGAKLPIEFFYKEKRSTTGYRSECKVCNCDTIIKTAKKRKEKLKGEITDAQLNNLCD